jgi:hypothetical protein
MNKPSRSRALPFSKPTGPETYKVNKGANVWPELRHVDRDVREDLEAVLRRRGRSADEFYVSDTPSRLDPPRFGRIGETSLVVAEMIVRSRKTGIARAYLSRDPGPTTGPFVEWVNQFAEDLDNGLFE